MSAKCTCQQSDMSAKCTCRQSDMSAKCTCRQSGVGKVICRQSDCRQSDPNPSEEQAGFRKDRSTVHQILTLRLIAEKAKRHGKKIYNCFIDFQKAFDTIKQKVIWATLRSYGIEEKMVTLLQKIYEKAQSTVRIGKHQGEWFHTDLGTRQGDPLSL